MQVLGRIVVVIVEYKVAEDLHDPYVGHEIGHEALLLLHLHHLRAKRDRLSIGNYLITNALSNKRRRPRYLLETL